MQDNLKKIKGHHFFFWQYDKVCAAGCHCGVYASVAGNTMWKCGGKSDFVKTELNLAGYLIIRFRVTEHLYTNTHINTTDILLKFDIDDCLKRRDYLTV